MFDKKEEICGNKAFMLKFQLYHGETGVTRLSHLHEQISWEVVPAESILLHVCIVSDKIRSQMRMSHTLGRHICQVSGQLGCTGLRNSFLEESSRTD